MNIAICYESVLPARGGCETYIVDLARRLVADGHDVHLYCCQWDAAALPPTVTIHALPPSGAPRFLRPWRFARACLEALRRRAHDVSVGFDKTWGQDVLYPQGGLHLASAEHNLRKHRSAAVRLVAGLAKRLDPAANSFRWLERRQYCRAPQPVIVVNSRMVREHFQRYYGIGADAIDVVPNGIDPRRFDASDRLERRREWRKRWQLDEDAPAGLFVAMNYRLKGLESLLRALRRLPPSSPLRLVVVGSARTQRFRSLAQRWRVADRVRFHGYCAETRHAYFAADFLVHPTFYDPCSLVVLEALACGLPVITSRYNGAAELLQPADAGLIIDDPHDDERLANALQRYGDPEVRRIAAEAAREAARRWTFDDHYRKMIDILRRAAARRASALPAPSLSSFPPQAR